MRCKSTAVSDLRGKTKYKEKYCISMETTQGQELVNDVESAVVKHIYFVYTLQVVLFMCCIQGDRVVYTS